MSLDPYRTPAEPERERPREQKARELVIPVLCGAALVVLVHYMLRNGAADAMPHGATPPGGEAAEVHPFEAHPLVAPGERPWTLGGGRGYASPSSPHGAPHVTHNGGGFRGHR